MAKLKVAVLVSGNGTNLQALIDAAQDPIYPAKIALVLSNVPNAYALTRAKAGGIATAVIDHKQYSDRLSFEAALQKQLQAYEIEFIGLAGFMRLLTDSFVNAWFNRLINIHPSLLPSFKGMNAHRDALAASVRFSGCTIHYVRPAVDDGPIIAQAVVPVLPDDNENTLGKRILKQEHHLYPLIIKLIAENRISVSGEQITFKGVRWASGAMVNPSSV